jgi:hypothetical protein
MKISPRAWAAYLDDECRIADMKVQRYRDNLLSRFGVKRENIEAFLWPSLIAIALWTGMPTLNRRQLSGIVVGAICFAVLVQANRRSRTPTQDLVVQVVLLFLLGLLIWVIGPDEAGTTSIVYRHLLIPVVVIVGIILLIASAMSRRLCEPLQRISLYRHYLANTELFQSRGTRVPLAERRVARIVFAVMGVLLRPLQLLWPVGIAVLVAPPAYVGVVAWTAFGLMGAILLLAVNDERLDSSVRLLTLRFFRNAALGVTLITLALAAARLMHNTYVTTLFDTASGIEIVLYLCFAYAIAWWYDYWTDRLIGQQLFLLIDQQAGGECSAAYGYTGPVVTSVPRAGRRIELQGLSRFLAYCPNPANAKAPYFQAWDYDDFFSLLASTGAAGGKGIPLPQQIRQRVQGYLGCAGIVALAFFAIGGWQLHRTAKEHELAAVSGRPVGLKLSSLINDQARDQTQPVILVAASGGGTRAAVFTGAVLEGISQTHGKDILAGSGVSGGSAALAYYASKRPDLAVPKPGSWDEFFDTLSMPFIQDVIERAAEWRMVEHGRLGVLLAESFERRWKLSDDRRLFGGVKDFGLICNSTLAGRFDRSFLTDDEGKGMDLSEAAMRYLDRTHSDVAGGRLILTNLDLQRAFSSRDLPFIPGEHLPILVSDREARIERGAALSANFPPVFSNAAVDVDGQTRYWVTDGGAADNRGLETILYALRDALKDSAQNLPSVVVVTIEASGIDEGFEQDRGLGSALGAGAHFADQLDTELANSLIARYRAARQEGDLKFYYVPMPRMLRKSGSFGTHWMLQNYITVNNESKKLKKTFTGEQVVAALRTAYSDQPRADGSQLADWIVATPEFKQWCSMLGSLGAAPGKVPTGCTH